MDLRPAPLDPPSHTWLELGEVRRLLLASYPGVVLQLDLDGRIAWASHAGAERLGYGPGELHGQAVVGGVVALVDVAQRAAQLSIELGELVGTDAGVFSARLRHNAVASEEHDWVLRHKDGSPQPTRLSIGPLRDHTGQVTGLLAVELSPDAGDAVRLPMAHHDTLTGLPSRAVLADRAEMALQRSTRQHSVLAVLLVEIVGFDALCEERGHSVGDDVLRSTASRLHFELRKTDTAVRIDRGQFAAMLVDLHTSDEALRVAEKVQKALSARINVGVALIPLSVRIGVAWYPAHGDQLLPLLQAAEGALPHAPAEGGVATPT